MDKLWLFWVRYLVAAVFSKVNKGRHQENQWTVFLTAGKTQAFKCKLEFWKTCICQPWAWQLTFLMIVICGVLTNVILLILLTWNISMYGRFCIVQWTIIFLWPMYDVSKFCIDKENSKVKGGLIGFDITEYREISRKHSPEMAFKSLFFFFLKCSWFAVLC